MTPMTLFRHMWMTNGFQIRNQRTKLPLETQKSEKMTYDVININNHMIGCNISSSSGLSLTPHPAKRPPSHCHHCHCLSSLSLSSLSQWRVQHDLLFLSSILRGRVDASTLLRVFLLARTAPIDPHRHPLYRTASSCPNCWVRNVLQDSESYECFLSQLYKCRYLPRQTCRFQGSGS